MWAEKIAGKIIKAQGEILRNLEIPPLAHETRKITHALRKIAILKEVKDDAI